ncbi:MAG: primosomal protein N', partial [Rikenellaceae bacterium]
MARYVEILFPLALELLTYEDGVGDLRVGEFVAAQMGSSDTARYYTGIVWRTDLDRPDYKRIRSVDRRVNVGATLSDRQQSVWEWVARYYLSTLGEVMNVALPSLIRTRGDDE